MVDGVWGQVRVTCPFFRAFLSKSVVSPETAPLPHFAFFVILMAILARMRRVCKITPVSHRLLLPNLQFSTQPH